uniref:Chloramphenicol-sensitive protein RarD n=1 Tax=uncultured Chloroflexota bacterium TaxID=166587 RepID=H5SDX4_9CHLR|nr:chloramphenicol-sensitive protein RarD [uncultured Chloroflexota bacterium]
MQKQGFLYAFGAYAIWGLFPIYWKTLHQVSAIELIGHRIFWSFLTLLGALLLNGQVGVFWYHLTQARIRRFYLIAALLIGFNWLIYVWGVNSDHIVETSLGYFINPLLSVLLGVLILRERLRPFQWLPLGLATVGVAYLTAIYGRVPWIALTLASTFALYGLVKKLAPLNSLHGLSLETAILFPLAFLYLLYRELTSQAAFLHSNLLTTLLLLGAGLVTTIPLLMFAAAAQRIPLSAIGLMQYIAPTLQFLIGVLIYHEPFDRTHLVGFVLVWIALALFAAESLFQEYRRRQRKEQAA